MWVSAIRLEIVPQEPTKEARRRRAARRGRRACPIAALRRLCNRPARIGNQTARFTSARPTSKKERYAMGLPVIGVTDTWLISTNDGPPDGGLAAGQAGAGQGRRRSRGQPGQCRRCLGASGGHAVPCARPLAGGPRRRCCARRSTIPPGGRLPAERDLLRRTFLLTTPVGPRGSGPSAKTARRGSRVPRRSWLHRWSRSPGRRRDAGFAARQLAGRERRDR